MQSNKISIIIPARYESTRLPGKPLMEVANKPIIQWVYEKASQSRLAGEVIVATDDERIHNAVKSFGGKVCMTSSSHASGSDRIAEVINKNPDIDIAVNVQGDEPLIDPASIDLAIDALISDSKADITTLIRLITDEEELKTPNIVKAVIDNNEYALYFSRYCIPYARGDYKANHYAHLGFYVYKRDALLRMTSLESSDLEQAECLEQLRALQNGIKIKTVKVNYKPIGIDTMEDLNNFREYIEKGFR